MLDLEQPFDHPFFGYILKNKTNLYVLNELSCALTSVGQDIRIFKKIFRKGNNKMVDGMNKNSLTDTFLF